MSTRIKFRHTHDCGEGSYFIGDGDDLTLTMYNQGGHDLTSIRVVELLAWLAKHRPDLIAQADLVAKGLR